MNLCLVAPGIMPIPPEKWGAVEMLLWDYFEILNKEKDIRVEIINTPHRSEILQKIHSSNFDIVHIHYDVFVDISSKIVGPKVVMSSHYPYINDRSKHSGDGYDKIFPLLADNRHFHILASSQKDINTFISSGSIPRKTHISRLGVRKESYSYEERSTYDKTLCFSQIVDRKRQSHIQGLKNIIFSGRVDDPNFNIHNRNYLGELPRSILNKEITKYPNFVLLSKTENTTPLAVKEALVCGLGVVVSEEAAYELNRDLPFITVLSEKEINDIKLVNDAIALNKAISKNCRKEIREYAINNFDITFILKNEYLLLLNKIRNFNEH